VAEEAPAHTACGRRGAPAAVVVVGVGNDLRRDDAAGLEAVRALRPLLSGCLAQRIDVREHERETLGLIELLEDAAAALIVDAVRSGAPPGTVHRVDAARAPVPERLHSSSSTHAIGVADAIELARSLGRLPAEAIVYGVEGCDLAAGEGLSEPVRAAVAPLAGELLREVRRLARLDDFDPVE
jgi:hydrogenase maturation protease